MSIFLLDLSFYKLIAEFPSLPPKRQVCRQSQIHTPKIFAPKMKKMRKYFHFLLTSSIICKKSLKWLFDIRLTTFLTVLSSVDCFHWRNIAVASSCQDEGIIIDHKSKRILEYPFFINCQLWKCSQSFFSLFPVGILYSHVPPIS